MADTVTLRNRTRFPITINLYHGLVPEMAKRSVVGTLEHDIVSGVRSLKAHVKPVSGSVTLLARGTEGDTVRELPRTVLRVPEIQQLLSEKKLEEVKVVGAPPAEEPAGEGQPPTGEGPAPSGAPSPGQDPPPDPPQPPPTKPDKKSSKKDQE